MKTQRSAVIKQGWLRAVLYIIAIIIIAVAIQFAVPFVLGSYQNATGTEASKLENFILSYIPMSAGILLVTWFFRRVVDRQSFASLGFQWNGFKNEALLGFFTGPALLGIGTIALVLLGYLTFMGITFDPAALTLELLVLILVAITEEVMFRGYLLNNLMQSTNKWVALLISAILFGLFHSANPDVSVLAVVNVFIAGLLLGINYIYTKNLWFGILFHLSWNFFQGPILGYDVSGNGFQSLFQQTIEGPAHITGGLFGFEGSLICALLIALATAYFAYLFSKMYITQVAPNDSIAKT